MAGAAPTSPAGASEGTTTHEGPASRGPDIHVGGPAIDTRLFAIERDFKRENCEGCGGFMLTHTPYCLPTLSLQDFFCLQLMALRGE